MQQETNPTAPTTHSGLRLGVQRIRTIAADPHPVILYGVMQALNHYPEIELVGQARAFLEVVRQLKTRACDVLVLDLSISGDTSGTALFDYLRQHFPDIQLVVLIALDRDPSIWHVLQKHGVKAIVRKDDCTTEVAEAVLRVVCGREYFSPSVRAILDAMCDADSGAGRGSRAA